MKNNKLLEGKKIDLIKILKGNSFFFFFLLIETFVSLFLFSISLFFFYNLITFKKIDKIGNIFFQFLMKFDI